MPTVIVEDASCFAGELVVQELGIALLATPWDQRQGRGVSQRALFALAASVEGSFFCRIRR